jgi:hypothetical protein
MAVNDIRVWNSPHGGHTRIEYFRVNASETFWAGEPVAVNADGELTESADDPGDNDIIGIAAGVGNLTTGRDWRTDATMVTGATVPVYVADSNARFITGNFMTTSEAAYGTTEPPTLAHLGDEAGLELVSGVWGVNIGATNNTVRIMDVLDANFESLQENTGGTGVYVVFVILGSQTTSPTAPDAPAS